MYSLVRYGHCGRVHSGDEPARGFSTSHRDISWRTSKTPRTPRRPNAADRAALRRAGARPAAGSVPRPRSAERSQRHILDTRKRAEFQAVEAIDDGAGRRAAPRHVRRGVDVRLGRFHPRRGVLPDAVTRSAPDAKDQATNSAWNRGRWAVNAYADADRDVGLAVP